ncbi:MAG TPA: hypothetical protein VF136_08575 [Methylomirabilota bacterium]
MTVTAMARLLAALLTLVLAAPVAAQSLADIARREEARRKRVKSPSKVITNKDLRPVPRSATPPAPVAGDGTEAAGPTAEGEQAAPTGGEQAAPTEEEQREQDEQAWRQKMADARMALERSEMYLDALQSKINALWADFTARDDPAQRAQLEIERQRAQSEFERVKGEVEERRKAIGDLEEAARRAGVPPGWLR